MLQSVTEMFDFAEIITKILNEKSRHLTWAISPRKLTTLLIEKSIHRGRLPTPGYNVSCSYVTLTFMLESMATTNALIRLERKVVFANLDTLALTTQLSSLLK